MGYRYHSISLSERIAKRGVLECADDVEQLNNCGPTVPTQSIYTFPSHCAGQLEEKRASQLATVQTCRCVTMAIPLDVCLFLGTSYCRTPSIRLGTLCLANVATSEPLRFQSHGFPKHKSINAAHRISNIMYWNIPLSPKVSFIISRP